ncbi:MAG: AMP-binding protein [Candidatus Sulfotelmatobacter sp.]
MESLIEFVRKYGCNADQTAVRQRRGYCAENWTYSQIVAGANRVAWDLDTRGVKLGDAVLLCGPNSAEWIVVFFGCLLCGAVVVPIDRASTKEFAGRVCREVDAKVAFWSKVDAKDISIPSISLESIGGHVGKRPRPPFPSPLLSRQSTLEIIFTSGTTAEPRGVVISHGNVLANVLPLEVEIRKYLHYEKFVHPLRFLNLLPLSHVFGQMLGVFIPPLLAGTVAFLDSARPADIAETIRKERISVLVAVPRFIESLQREIERGEERDGKIDRFRRNYVRAEGENVLRRWWRFRKIHRRLGWKFWAFISGGAALTKPTETFWNRLGYAVIQGYGMTETASLITLNHPFRAAGGSIGKTFHGAEVRLSKSGEILVRGESIAIGYRQNGRTYPAAGPDGWFNTGDIAEKDEEGRLYFKGRTKNVIVTSAGMNVYPDDLESALKGQPGVRDCVVVGIELNGEERPCAALIPNVPEFDGEAAVAAANTTLAEYQKIGHWFIWPDPDFPRTATQKPMLAPIRDVARLQNGRATANVRWIDALGHGITQVAGQPLESISEDANFETDLHLSSLDRVELMSRLEERHQVDLSEVEFQEMATVGQLKNLLLSQASATANHVYPEWPQNRLVTLIRLAIYYLLALPATYLLAAPRVHGRENLRELNGPVLVISNHVTYLDIAWILPALTQRIRNRLATTMGGERLARMRCPGSGLSVFARVMERMRYGLVTSLFNVFPLPQRSVFRKSFNFAGDLVNRGWSVLVFPEGQTTEDGRMFPFLSGIGLLTRQLNIPVVPIFLDGLLELKQGRRFFAWPRQVRVTIGQPVQFPEDMDADKITRELERRVRQLQRLRSDFPDITDTDHRIRKEAATTERAIPAASHR